jgi:hypothetical protein
MVLPLVPIRPRLRIRDISPNKVGCVATHKTATYCARHRCGADEAVLVRISARTDSRFLGKRRPMSFMNRRGRSIHFIDGSIAPEIDATRPIAGLNLSSMETFPPGRVAIPSLQAPVLITRAARKRSTLNSKLPAALTALPAWASPSGTALLAPPRRRSRCPQVVFAPSRDDPLASVS